MKKLAGRHFRLVFACVMGAVMVFFMTFVVTLANVGLTPDFLYLWAKSYAIAFVVVVPLIYFLVPRARAITARFVELP